MPASFTCFNANTRPSAAHAVKQQLFSAAVLAHAAGYCMLARPPLALSDESVHHAKGALADLWPNCVVILQAAGMSMLCWGQLAWTAAASLTSRVVLGAPWPCAMMTACCGTKAQQVSG